MSKYDIEVWEYADTFKNLDTNETFGGVQVCELLEQKDQRIAELEEQLKNALCPKFKIGQIVYFNDDYGQILSGSIIAFDYYTSSYIIIDIFGNEVWRRTGDVLKTKEEAEQKLAEIKGER